MHSNITKIIDQYLLGELSIKDQVIFEQRLASNPELQTELALQRNINEAAHRASVRADIQHVGRRYRLNRILKMSATGFGILAIAAMSMYFIQNSMNSTDSDKATEAPVVALETAEELNEFVQFNNVPVQYFSIAKEGDFKLSEEGVLLSIPENAFLLNGNPYSGPSILQYQEAIDAATIIKGGLNTMAGDKLLETQGMFSIQAYTPDGTALEINPVVGIYIQVPVDECLADMQLFEGIVQNNGRMDWQNPVPLEKIPLSIPMNDLNFYPVGYEAKLDKLKWKKSKKSRDSLYVSFEVEYSSQKTISTGIQQASGMPITNPSHGTLVTDPEPISTIVVAPTIFTPELLVEFPGGANSLRAYIAKNTKYPQYAILQGVSGVVYVSFTTNERGQVENAYVENSIHPALDKEALRLINNMPEWVPVNEGGIIRRATHRVPIKFMLEGDLKSLKPSNALFMGVSVPDQQDVTFSIRSTTPQSEGEVGDNKLDTDSLSGRYPFVSPSKVLAMWKPKFENTNLATREFERRMKAIHSTCNDAVLAKYTRQLSKPISEIDREVVAMGYAAFNAFAAEQIGAVNPNNPHLKNLQKFYDQGVKALRKEAKKNRDWEQKLRAQRDIEINKERTAHVKRTAENKRKSTEQELAVNKKRLLKQTRLNGPNRTIRQAPNYRPSAAAMLPQFNRTASFTVRRSGACNLDRYRPLTPAFAEVIRKRDSKLLDLGQVDAKNRIEFITESATIRRQTVTFNENGRTTVLAYNDFSFEVANPEKYIKLFGYLFPSKMNSYQFIDCADGDFEYKLNANIIYDVCIIGITEDGYEYFQKQTLNGGDLGKVELKRLTEKDLEASIRQLNGKRISRPAPILGELDWVRAEANNYREQKRRMKMQAFRKAIEETIFPCYSAGSGQIFQVGGESNNNEPTPKGVPEGQNPLIMEIRVNEPFGI